MNSRLQSILNFIQQSETLSDEEKSSLFKAVKDTDKELEIITFKLDRTEKVKRTTAILLEETIAELEQKRKAVEAQNRELEIESSLERVRTVAMGMKLPADMLDICRIMSEQLELLGIKEIRNVQTAIFYEDKGTYMNYEYYRLHNKSLITEVGYTSDKMTAAFAVRMMKGPGEFFTESLKGKALKEWIEFQKTTPMFADSYLAEASSLNYYWFSLGPIALGMSTYAPLGEEEIKLFNRFRNVFDLAYRRFLDIEKAETRAMEARIEASLERMRAVAMSMRKSEELITVCESMYKELTALGFTNIRNAQISIKNHANQSYFVTEYSDHVKVAVPEAPYDSSPIIQEIYNEMERSKDAFYQKEFSGKEFEDWRTWRMSIDTATDNRILQATSMCFYLYSTGEGYLGISTFNVITKDQVEILKRFKNVFELSYRRYKDVAQAEAQAREAQIEASLERIRSMAMGMRKSEELMNIIHVVFGEWKKLGLDLYECNINLLDREKREWTNWGTGVGEAKLPKSYTLAWFDHPFLNQQYEDILSGFPYRLFILEGDDYHQFLHHLFTQTDFKNSPKEYKDALSGIDKLYLGHAYMKYGSVDMVGAAPLPEPTTDILKRFAKVFEQAYTRYLDLAQAEAQTREAQIELALERVRARAMAMHHSDELNKVLPLLFDQFDILGICPSHATISLIDVEKNSFTFRMTGKAGTRVMAKQVIALDALDMWKDTVDQLKSFSAVQVYCNEYPKEVLPKLWELVGDVIAAIPEDARPYPADFPDGMYEAVGIYRLRDGSTYGTISFCHNRKATEEEKDIVGRFATEFGRLYQRFLDLQKSEAQAWEAQIEASLERVRAKVMAMNSSNDLNETSLVFGEQLRKLGIDWQFSYFWLIEEDKDENTFWITWPDNKTSTTTYSLAEADESFKECIIAWKEQVKIHSTRVPVRDVQAWLDTFERITNDAGGVAVEIMKPNNFKNGVYYYDAMIKFGSFGILMNRAVNDEEKNIQFRFATEFERAYTRFLDLQKAEAQAREAQIELGLERVRARAMAMQSSNELSELVDTVFKELTKLDFALTWCIINIIDESTLSNTVWAANPDIDKAPESYHMKFEDYPFHDAMMKGWKERKTKYVYVLEGPEKKVYDEYLFKETEFRKVPEAAQAASRAMDKYVVTFSFSNFGGLQTVGDVPLSDANLDILSRFGKVFDLTYTRFNDLKQAEAQAKESQIQLALERVRSKTMAMHHSEELKEVISVTFEQLKSLNITIDSCIITLFIEGSDDLNNWVASAEQKYPQNVQIPYLKHPLFDKIALAKNNPGSYFTLKLSQKENQTFYKHILKNSDFGKIINEERRKLVMNADSNIMSFANFQHTGLRVGNFHNHTYTQDENNTILRFANVFEQTYTRFLDLQKAEAQAREAQIEAALERVRSRSMGMQKSEELKEVIQVVYEQFVHLNIHIEHTGFIMDYKERDDMNIWLADQHEVPFQVTIPYFDCAHWNSFNEAKEKGTDFFANHLSFEEKNRFYQDLFKLIPGLPEEAKEYYFSCPGLAVSTVLLENVGLYIENFSGIPYTDEENNTLMRFGKVFQQTYTRFLDLQKAEAQAREAQIEAALEKVRSRSLAMHKSAELQQVVTVAFDRLKELNISMDAANIVIFSEGTRDADLWIASPGQEYVSCFHLPYVEHLIPSSIFNAREKGDDFFAKTFSFEEKNKYFNYLFEHSDFRHLPENRRNKILAATAYAVSFAFTKNAAISIHNYSDKPFSDEENNILKRFAKVFEQAYTRFLDLQKAEAQAREAQIELALERVRARTMAMQKSEELSETAQILFQQFKELGEDPIQITIGIINEEKRIIEFRVTDWSGSGAQVNRSFNVDIDEPALIHKMYTAWKDQKKSLVIDLSGKELQDWINYRNAISGVNISSADTKGRRVITSAFFSKGHLSFSTPEPRPPETIQLLERFAGVFDLTYTRFLDLKNAEAQAREAQIEAALERVRSRTMGMQKSEELKEVIQVVYEQFVHLNIHVEHTGFIMDYKTRDDMHIWLADKHAVPFQVTIPYFDCAHWNSFNEAKEKGIDFFANHLSFEEKNRFYQDLFKLIPGVPEETLEYYFSCPGLAISTVLLDNVGLYIENFSGIPYSDEENATLMRFGKVFQQTYTRFLDLQKAEAQAREAKIEASLERTRTQSMIMQHSKELDDTLRVFHEQVLLLGINSAFSFLWLPDEEKDRHIFWAAWEEDKNDSTVFKSKAINYPLDRNEPATAQCLVDWKSNEPVYSYHVPPAAVENYFAAWQELIDGVEQLKPEYFSGGLYYVEAFMKYGCFGVMVATDLTEDEKKTLARFAIEFERTYTRFLDLQKAEAQTREAQIEASLERVRARTMAMHSSDDVGAATAIMFTELEKLGIENFRGGILNIKPDETMEVWSVNTLDDGRVIRAVGTFDMTIHSFWQQLYKGWINKDEFLYYLMAGKEKEDYIKILDARRDYLPDGIQQLPDSHIQSYYFGEGYVWTFTLQPHSEEDKQVMKRFASVFSLTFRRYQDLKKAEAQAREAQIEAALERVRSRTMGMQHSNELQDTALLLFQQILVLGVSQFGCGFNIWDDDRKAFTAWMGGGLGENTLVPPFKVSSSEDVFLLIHEAAERGESLFVREQAGEELETHYRYMNSMPLWKEIMEGITLPIFQVMHCAFFSQGFLMFISPEPIPEAHDIFKRFAKVFEQTYTRFNDLKKAEAQALEAIKRASVDRVRAEIASMRTTKDLERITPLVWNELTTLGVPFIRCGVFIMDEELQKVHTFLSTPEGKAIATMHVPFEFDLSIITNGVQYWRKKKVYTEYWDADTFTRTWIKLSSLRETSIESPQREHPPESLYLHLLPFLQGMLYVGNNTPLNEDALQLVQNLADAFSTAYARYEDFNKLEAAKKQVDSTLNELQATQKQLIQSEKMASLGELTAGIAHEIQNPLNFVNNFSEVSTELLDEMITELGNNNKEDAIAIADDVKQNLEKILHHGKRADGIVKGMLQHSRSSSAVKEPTDINKLADEYLRLAYHGLRAKDKSFNATLKTDYDETIGNINIIPQDIGRAVLNLITNAFYAVTEKKKQIGNGYEPTVAVSTKKMNGKVEIGVADNGNGIPQKLLDKIFQPFFTTKPTGQGTGLGLSLSYDIVKAHGGEVKVETNEGEGSEFIIQLPIA